MNLNRQVQVKELVELINGYGFESSDWEREGVPIIRIQNLNNLNAGYNYSKKVLPEKYSVRKGDILIAWAGSLGVFEWEQETEGILNQHLYKVKFRSDEIDRNYFKYVMGQALLELSAKARGVGLKHLKKEQLDNYKFKLPVIDDQKKSVQFLSKIENLIKKREQSINLLSDYISNIFLELFLENPHLTNNPKYWGTIEDVVEDSIYGTSKKSNDEGLGYPMLRMNNLTYSGDFLLEDMKWIEMDIEEMKKYELKNGDILFNRTNSKELVGKTAVWDGPNGYVFAGYLVKIILDNSKMTSNYFSGYMNSSFGKKILFSKGKSSGNLVNFSPPLLKEQKILIPPITSQIRYDEIYTKAKEHKVTLNKSLNLLRELRRSAINDLLNGTSDVDDLDRLINDDVQLELFLNTINKSDYSNEEQYDFDIKRLYSIIERTEKRNKENSEYLKGVIQRIENDEIIIETNKEYKYRLSDEAAKNRN